LIVADFKRKNVSSGKGTGVPSKVGGDCATVSRNSSRTFSILTPRLRHKLTFTKVVFRYHSWAQKGMADYYPLISNAIAALDKKNGEGRSAFYDRARAILADRLRKAEPPLSESIIEQERLALEDAISKAEADATRSEETRPISDSPQIQTDHTQDYIRAAMVEALPGDPVAKLQRERRFAFWGFLILAALWIGDLFYKPLTFSGWYDWLRLGGVIFFPTMAILSYLIVRKKLSEEEEERAYIISAPIVLVGTILVTVALYWIFGRIAATPS
jgi:hypothetical protein